MTDAKPLTMDGMEEARIKLCHQLLDLAIEERFSPATKNVFKEAEFCISLMADDITALQAELAAVKGPQDKSCEHVWVPANLSMTIVKCATCGLQKPVSQPGPDAAALKDQAAHREGE